MLCVCDRCNEAQNAPIVYIPNLLSLAHHSAKVYMAEVLYLAILCSVCASVVCNELNTHVIYESLLF